MLGVVPVCGLMRAVVQELVIIWPFICSSNTQKLVYQGCWAGSGAHDEVPPGAEPAT